MVESSKASCKALMLLLLAAALFGCSSSKVYLCAPASAEKEKATIYLKFLGPGGRVFVFDDTADLSFNSILGFNAQTNGILWCYLHPDADKDSLLFGRPLDPAASYAFYDKVLSQTRSKQMDNDLWIRRAITIGFVESGQTIKWTRPAGKFRIGVTVRNVMYPNSASFLGYSDWWTAKTGKSYQIDYSFDIRWGGQMDELEHTFVQKGIN